MLAVARAFQAHCDSATASQVLDIVTGRPDVYNLTLPADPEEDGFNRVPNSSNGSFRDILLPVVAEKVTLGDNFLIFTHRDENAYKSGDVGPVHDQRAAFPDTLLWLLPPFDHSICKGRFLGQIARVPLHPAVCRAGKGHFVMILSLQRMSYP
jgi:hypothetical protein